MRAKIQAWLDAFPDKRLWTIQELLRKSAPSHKERQEVKEILVSLGFTFVRSNRLGKTGWLRP